MGYWFRLKAKCKRTLPLYLTEYNVMKTLGGVEVWLYMFFTSSLDGGEW